MFKRFLFTLYKTLRRSIVFVHDVLIVVIVTVTVVDFYDFNDIFVYLTIPSKLLFPSICYFGYAIIVNIVLLIMYIIFFIQQSKC